jgi:cobalt-precorrin 5A hydrolase / precorrin-3B C17-methyltransferase
LKSTQSTAIIVLSESGIAIARQIQITLSASSATISPIIYGLETRTSSADQFYARFSDVITELFSLGHPIVGICAAGILIRALAPVLRDKRAEPPVLAIAEDGSAVVPLLGGLNGANDLAKLIALDLNINAAITTAGELRFQTTLLSPPEGYRLLNSDQDAKTFVADLLTGIGVRLIGNAPWLHNLPVDIVSTHTIEVREFQASQTQPSPTHLIYELIYERISEQNIVGSVAIIGIGPGAKQWMSPEVRNILRSGTDFVGYNTYLNLVAEFTNHGLVHASDNRVELDRARLALDLAAQGRRVVVVSSGDAGIYGMAAAVFEVLDQELKPEWSQIDIDVAPGISAMQAAAALVGAPLGHDFSVISLSDILKPWQKICERITAAAQADFAIAFYNPVSLERTWQLTQAKEILLQWRSPTTPVILGHNLGRPHQQVKVITLGELSPELADMRTIILVGSSRTRTLVWQNQIKVYTPRSY